MLLYRWSLERLLLCLLFTVTAKGRLWLGLMYAAVRYDEGAWGSHRRVNGTRITRASRFTCVRDKKSGFHYMEVLMVMKFVIL